jgi:hypothetical protein
MLRARMATFDLSGTWAGHYEQNGERHRIVMRVAQRGDTIAGEMRDGDPFVAGHYVRLADDAAASGRVVAHAEIFSALPERSSIHGSIAGDRVRLTKTYLGDVRTSAWVVDAAAAELGAPGYHYGDVQPGHAVLYRGRLAASGDTWRGFWRIRVGDAEEDLLDRFELRRVAHA